MDEILNTPTPQEIKQVSYDDQLWRDRVREIASTGCPLETAAKVLDLDVRVFVGLVENHFHKSWITLQQEARLTVLIDLQIQAIAQVRKGRDKLLLLLDKHSLMPQLDVMKAQARDEGNGRVDVGRLSDEQLDKLVDELLAKTGRKNRYHDTETLTLRPATKEEIEQGNVPTAGEATINISTSNSERLSQSPEQISAGELIESDPPITPATEAQAEIPGPVVARPASGVFVAEDHVRVYETNGRVKKRMLEAL